MMKYSITESNLHLIDSGDVPKRRFGRELAEIKAVHPESNVWKRSYCSMKLEWATHNALYLLGIAVSRTKDCDLEYPQPWYMSVAYAIAGTLVWIFIP